MKLFILLFLSTFFYVNSFSQEIEGLWAGTLFNDSTQQYVFYELAVSENNGKYTGYSYTTFIVNGKEATGV